MYEVRFTPTWRRLITYDLLPSIVVFVAIAWLTTRVTGGLSQRELLSGLALSIALWFAMLGIMSRRASVTLGAETVEGPAEGGGRTAVEYRRLNRDPFSDTLAGRFGAYQWIETTGAERIRLKHRWFEPDDLERLRAELRARVQTAHASG